MRSLNNYLKRVDTEGEFGVFAFRRTKQKILVFQDFLNQAEA